MPGPPQADPAQAMMADPSQLPQGPMGPGDPMAQGPPDPAEQAAMIGALIGQAADAQHQQIDAAAQAAAMHMSQIIMETAMGRAQTADSAALGQ